MESTSHTEKAIQEADKVMKQINGRVVVLPFSFIVINSNKKFNKEKI